MRKFQPFYCHFYNFVKYKRKRTPWSLPISLETSLFFLRFCAAPQGRHRSVALHMLASCVISNSNLLFSQTQIHPSVLNSNSTKRLLISRFGLCYIQITHYRTKLLLWMLVFYFQILFLCVGEWFPTYILDHNIVVINRYFCVNL